MPAIDSLLSYISQKRIPLTIISAGRPLQCYIDEAPVAGSVVSEEQLVSMVREIAPASLVFDEPFSFDYSYGSSVFILSGKITGSNSQLEIRPATMASQAMTQPAVGVAQSPTAAPLSASTPAPVVTSSFSVGAPDTAAETAPFASSSIISSNETVPATSPVQAMPETPQAAPEAPRPIAPQPAPQSVSPQMPPQTVPPQESWFYAGNGMQQGPINGQTLREMLRSGQLPPNTMVWKHGLANWIPAAQSEIWPQGMTPPLASPTNYNTAYPQYNPQGVMTGDSTGGLIPYKNPQALTSYYLGVFSLIPCAALGLGPAAFYLGLQGLKFAKANPTAKGQAHAWVGIICGGFCGLLNWVVVIAIFVGIATSFAR